MLFSGHSQMARGIRPAVLTGLIIGSVFVYRGRTTASEDHNGIRIFDQLAIPSSRKSVASCLHPLNSEEGQHLRVA